MARLFLSGLLVQQLADIEKVLVVKCIEENDICAVRQALVEAVRNRLPGLLQVNQVYERHRLIRHFGEVHLDVAFVHRCDRMFAHHRMAVQAVSLITVDGEMVAESDIAAEQWYALDDDAARRFDHIEGNVGCMADAADLR